MRELTISQLKDSLLNLEWDCQSGWINSPSDAGVEEWSDEQVTRTATNIIKSLTESEDTDE